MKDFTQKLKENLSSFSQNLKTSSEEVFSKIKDGAESIGSIGSTSVDKMADMVNNVIDVLPLIEKAGYKTTEFRIHVAISPLIEINFAKTKEVSKEELDALHQQYHDKKMFNLILKMLHTADSLKSKIETDEFDFHEIVVDISIPPKVSLRYTRKNEKMEFTSLLGND